jgi:serine/threonine-protein kinase
MKDALEAWLSVQPRVARQDDVGRKMQGLFVQIREEVHRQIQRHMAAITAATNTQELQALTAESLQRMEQSGANISGQLLRLAGSSGSGSGVIPNYGGMGSNPSQYPHLASQSHMHGIGAAPPQPKSSNGLLMVIVIGCFVLLALLIVVVGLRDRKLKNDALAGTDPTSSSASGASTDTAPPPTGASTGTDEAPTAAPSDVGSASVPPTATAVSTKTVSHGTGHATPPKPTATPKTTASPPPPPPPPPKDEDPGFLTIQTTPWSKVTLNGKVICQTTPCNKVPVAPGSYVITLENAEKGIKKTHPVTIKSGEVTPKNIALD